MSEPQTTHVASGRGSSSGAVGEPDRVLATELASHPSGATVRLHGWVHRYRSLSSVDFLVLRDRSGLAQVVIREEKLRAAPLAEETAVDVLGTASANPAAPGGVEVIDPAIRVVSEAISTPPVPLWRPDLAATLPTLLDHAAVTWRHPRRRAGWELAAASLRGFRGVLDAQGFTEIHTPSFVSSATESGANVFEVDYFGRTAYLAQSPQFYKQQMVGVFERVYQVGPVFRAEPHDTVRHLAQYVSLDVELGFIQDHRGVLAVLGEVLRSMLGQIARDAGSAVELLGLRMPVIPEQIPVVHFSQALRLVGADPAQPDLTPDNERALGHWAAEEFGSDVLAVEGYPMAKRPFYTHPWTGDSGLGDAVPGGSTNGFDLLFRGLELVTGGQRLHRPGDYESALRARGDDPAAYSDYLQAFRYGMPPHGGFAIGLERWVAQLTGATNIREVTLFPRDLHRLTP